MAWITPVTNRTAGAEYTYTDLNRVENNAGYLADLLTSYGYIVSITPKTDWAVGDTPRAADIVRYLANITSLINAYYTIATTPTIPANLLPPAITKANDIEQILTDIEALINLMIASFRPAGTFVSGQANILPRRVV